MRNILTKVKIHYTYLIMAFGLIITGNFANLIVFSSIIITHELGHILLISKFKYKIKKTIFYPYGGITKIDTLINTDINKDLLIAIAGLLFQEIYFLCIFFLYGNGLIRQYIFNLFVIYNKSIFIFNILPIIPLDGSKIVNLLLSKIINFNLSNILTIVISFITLILVLLSGIFEHNYTIIMIIGVLLQNIYTYYNKLAYMYNRFVLERYLYDIKYNKIKIIKDKKKMYKNKKHLFNINNKYIEEKDYLNIFFSKNS